ncbi:MAG: diguanylate cyclase [Clostridiaceae bacterium]|nr:diguanylate cyclase [Eubacteriales bacterium]
MYDAQAVMAAARKMFVLYCKGQYQRLYDEYVAEDALFILPDHAIPLSGKADLDRHLFRANAASALARHLTGMRFEIRNASRDVFVLCGILDADQTPICNPFLSGTVFNLSCGFRATPQGLKLIILHTSIPFSERSLQRAAADIYGAVFLCAADERLSLLQMNESFISLFGYTREEIETRFSLSFLEMADPEGRKELLRFPSGPADIQETEFRVTAKGGESKWVMQRRQLCVDMSGAPYFCCILVDISAGKKLQLALSMSLRRHEIILNQTNDIIFEWDLLSDRLDLSSNWEKLFHYAPRSAFRSKILEIVRVHPDDRPALVRFFNAISQGSPYVEGEARIARADGTYLWCRGRSTQQFDQEGTPIKAIGVIANIDEEKQRAQKLMEKAERDTLTGLYNKGTVQALISEHLLSRRGDVMDALLIIDIDNFKGVNDSEGHPFGDTLLIHIAGCLNGIFRSSDLIGRIGGDEFIVLARDIPDIGIIRQKAEQLLLAVRALSSGEKHRFAVSCSIGIAIATEENTALEELYSNADWALYKAKRGGKNRYALYENDDSPVIRSAYTTFAKEIKG